MAGKEEKGKKERGKKRVALNSGPLSVRVRDKTFIISYTNHPATLGSG